MKLVTVAGPPSVGKTAVVLKVAERLRVSGARIGVVKFDALSTSDDLAYQKIGLPVQVGLSGNLCPDHFFVSNIDDCLSWGREQGFDYLISESAGLCNRCSPHIKDVLSLCVVDCLSGINTPKKIGPMLKLADIVVITKGDIVSQAEREVFAFMVRRANPLASLVFFNGITGQGAVELSFHLQQAAAVESLEGRRLRFSMPSAVCPYCVGETTIGRAYQRGNVKKINLDPTAAAPPRPSARGEDRPEEAADGLPPPVIDSLTILGGQDKTGRAEDLELTLRAGDVLCLVGPTGSGKSRLLADIECLAQGDTPSGRRLLVNGHPPADSQRFSLDRKLVAQLSQNMNFVVDLSVEEFVTLHAECRRVASPAAAVRAVIACANDITGEKFAPSVSVTQLSGGQTRALMIADTALLSASPVVLIDEIENAGVDRQKSLDLLVRKEKIVLLSTHDPFLALMGERRIVLRNGGIAEVIPTSAAERRNLVYLERFDAKIVALRHSLRNGERIDSDLSW